jgi:transcriptional regulator with XRE-family HTH domain
MTPDELLRLYPRETLRWLRRRLGLNQERLAASLGFSLQSFSRWEGGKNGISRRNRELLAALLATHLATPEGEAFVRPLGRGGAATAEGEA